MEVKEEVDSQPANELPTHEKQEEEVEECQYQQKQRDIEKWLSECRRQHFMVKKGK
jgi:hypothetical protein